VQLIYKIEYPLNFRSIYSKRLYYYLKRFEDTGWRIDKLAEYIYKSAKGNIELIKEKYKLSKQCKSITNLIGWIIKAIQEDYKNKGKNNSSFCDYDQRNYDFEELEKQLLGWNNKK